MNATLITTQPFGASTKSVTITGLGGEGILRTTGKLPPAQRLIRQALEQGLGYFDSARVYQDSEIYLGSIWQQEPALRQKIFQTSKSARRDKAGALAELEETLTRLHTDYLDLWQIHDVRSEDDLNQISGPGGALEAFVAAKKAGKVRHIGVTGHHSPKILTRAVREWPVDSVLLPVNPVEEILGGFLTDTLPAARQKNMAVIGMKILGASHYVLPKFEISAALLIRYALSFGITVAIVGCSDIDEVQTLAATGRTPKPLTPAEHEHLLNTFRPFARRLAFYRGDFS